MLLSVVGDVPSVVDVAAVVVALVAVVVGGGGVAVVGGGGMLLCSCLWMFILPCHLFCCIQCFRYGMGDVVVVAMFVDVSAAAIDQSCIQWFTGSNPK